MIVAEQYFSFILLCSCVFMGAYQIVHMIHSCYKNEYLSLFAACMFGTLSNFFVFIAGSDNTFYLPLLWINLFYTLFLITCSFAVITRDVYTREIRHLINKKLNESLVSLQLKETNYLSSRLKPHFLFNVINMIDGNCYADVAKARELTLLLDEYLNVIFYYDNLSNEISLRDELKITRLYTTLEMERFTNLTVTYDLPTPLPELKISALSLQPAVDDAIHKGVRSSSEPGSVCITMKLITFGRWELIVSSSSLNYEEKHFILTE